MKLKFKLFKLFMLKQKISSTISSFTGLILSSRLAWISLEHITTGRPYTKEQVNQKKYKLNEIFTDITVNNLVNNSGYKVREYSTLAYGHCYVIKKLEPVMLGDYSPVLYLKTRIDLTMIYHEDGEETWAFFGVFPDLTDVVNLPISVKNDIEIMGVELVKRR